MTSSLQYLQEKVREIPNFPKEGILFRDLTTLIKDAKALEIAADLLYEKYKDQGITQVVGIESRGFILGSILAYKLHAGLVLIRKKGKLPCAIYSKSYQLEYGMDSIEMHQDALKPTDKVLLHDDLLATGGTTLAAIDLIRQAGVKEIDLCFLMELLDLGGRDKLPASCPLYTLLQYA